MRVSDSFTALSSWAAFTVTVCAVAQLSAVKVSWSLLSVVPEIDRAVPLCPDSVTVTVLEGSVASFTV